MKNIKFYILGLLSLLTLALTVLGSTLEVSQAGGFCSTGLGPNLKEKAFSINVDDISHQDLGNRNYTARELFSSSMRYAKPYGIVKGDGFLISENNQYGEIDEEDGEIDEEVEKRLESLGEGWNCVGTGFQAAISISGWSISVSNFMAGMITWVTELAFTNSLVCKTTESTGCVDLLGVIGGESGIIKSLSNGLFLPLSVIMFVIVGVWLMYTGLLKRELRLGLSGVLWSVFAFILGIFTLIRPTMVATLPQTINTEIANCILDAMQGKSCIGGGNSTSGIPYDTSNVCVSSSSEATSTDEQMAMKVNSLTCLTTKGFALNQWAKEQFGYNFDELWTKNPPNGYTPYKVDDPNAYCINMYSTSSPNEITSSTKFTSGEKCNIALAYLANVTTGDFGEKVTLKDIVILAAKDPKMWNEFTYFGDSPFAELFAAVIIFICFVPIGIITNAYSLVSIVLMAFAPIYVLIGIHPGKGKKIFLGWLEVVVSNILKYFASLVLIFVMVIIFGSAMTNLDGPALFVAAVVLAVAFMSYRKEFVNLIGMTNMGGQKMRNMAEDRMKKLGQTAKHGTNAVVGGAVGGAALAIQENEDTGVDAAKNILKGTVKGAGAGIATEMKRGRGAIANATRSYGQIKNQNAKEATETQREERENLARSQATQQFSKGIEDFNNRQEELKLNDIKSEFNDRLSNIDTMKSLESYGMNGIVQELQTKKDIVELAKTPEEASPAILEFNQLEKTAADINVSIKNAGNNVPVGIQNYMNTTGNNIEQQYLNNVIPYSETVAQSATNEFQEAKLDNIVNESVKGFENSLSEYKKSVENLNLNEVKVADLHTLENNLKDKITTDMNKLGQLKQEFISKEE